MDMTNKTADQNQESLWTPIPNSPDYVCEKYGLIAIYKDSFRGHGNYWTFTKVTPPSKRTMGNALATGGYDASETLCLKLVETAKVRAAQRALRTR